MFECVVAPWHVCICISVTFIFSVSLDLLVETCSLFSFGLTMLPSRRPAARDALGVWYFEAWRYDCQWFLQEDENMQAWLRYEWSAREKRYQQAGQRSTEVLAFRMQLGLEMALIFHEEDRKFHLNRFLAIQSDLKESARANKEKLEERERERERDEQRGLSLWQGGT